MLRKNRKLPIIVGSLAAVALLSVGFSTWIISGQAQPVSLDNVNMQVGDVSDRRLKLAIDNASCDKVLNFDGLSQGSAGNISGTADSEDLQFKAVFTLTSEGGVDLATLKTLFTGISFTLTTDDTDYAAAITGNAIDAPLATGTALEIPFTDNAVVETGANHTGTSIFKYKLEKIDNSGDKLITFTATFNYNYGSVFGNKNPIYWEGDVTTAVTNGLTLLNNMHDGVSLSLTIGTY